jgi:hypothetical protein
MPRPKLNITDEERKQRALSATQRSQARMRTAASKWKNLPTVLASLNDPSLSKEDCLNILYRYIS